MKKLPGVEIDRSGNITMNGTPISKIIVNGEEFFGDDPQIALKNLPKEIVDKIQVTDTKTEAQAFTGEDGDSNNKTVNITIKEDKNKGYFARATAGYGTDDRYEASAIFNYFDDELRTSILASSNNINSSGFSYDETFGMMGRSAAAISGGPGITKSESAGINAANKWKNKWGFKEVETSGDYFFGRNDTEQRSESQTEYLLPDSRYFRNTERSSNFINDSHRGNAEFEIEFDTLTRISVKPKIDANFAESYSQSFSESLDENRNLVNNTETAQNGKSESLRFENQIGFIKKFGNKGAFFRLGFSNKHENQNSESLYYSETTFFEEENNRIQVQDQFIDLENKEDAYSLEARHRLPASESLSFDSSYDFDYSYATNKRYVYDSENNDGNYNSINDTLSNDFSVLNRIHAPRFGLNYEIMDWEIEADLGLLLTHLENDNLFQETTFENDYTNLNVSMEIKYEQQGEPYYSLDYETSTEIPFIRQLQPVVDRTDPLNIIIGNPELRPTYRHQINLQYRNFNYNTSSGISSWLWLNFIENDIVSISTIDEDLVRETRFTNIDGSINAHAGVSYNKGIRKENKQYNFSLSLSGSYNKNLGFTNGIKYQSEQYSFNPSVRLTYVIEKVLEINPIYGLTYRSSVYDINAERNENFINHQVGLDFTTYWPENLIFANDISYRYLENVAPGLQNSSILWNLSLGYQFFEDKATIRFKVYDLLDQNIQAMRIINNDYIRDSNDLILTRYAMLSFSYKLSSFGGRSRP
ncbi:outer membrane beta-barrel protein [Autumnicola musiva]|uniref:Outer membrane beta-barrel protein n=1 Tax=Autumnicola musiva TaxID=3075589 RepID=A0ABU3D7U7_9FLAO|nr:outer membrane beta-barrel protein [Zunongwangia sp. F117]MDT0677605.1 outer membrane beta-barrel protein [Zunongwangia sp. F117]